MSKRPPATIEYQGWTYRRMGKPGRPKKESKIIDHVVCWWCPCCEEWVPGSDFNKHKRQSNGLDSWCRQCRKDDHAMRRAMKGGGAPDDSWREEE